MQALVLAPAHPPVQALAQVLPAQPLVQVLALQVLAPLLPVQALAQVWLAVSLVWPARWAFRSLRSP